MIRVPAEAEKNIKNAAAGIYEKKFREIQFKIDNDRAVRLKHHRTGPFSHNFLTNKFLSL